MGSAVTSLVTLLAMSAALHAQAGEQQTRFGWGVSIEQTRIALGSRVSALNECAEVNKRHHRDCRAVIIERHRMGKYVYRLELQHHARYGLHKIVVFPTSGKRQLATEAIAYSLLLFDAALSESYGKLTRSSSPIELQDRTNNAKPGFQWNAIYGPPSNRLNLIAQFGNHANRSEFLAIELVAKY